MRRETFWRSRRAAAIKLIAVTGCIVSTAAAFEGKIESVITQGSETTPLLYTVGENFLRIEVTDGDRPNPIDIVDLKSGALTLLYSHNRSFVRLKSAVAGVAEPGPGKPAEPRSATPNAFASRAAATTPTMPMPPGGLPPGIGPQSQGATAPNISTIPQMPAMPPMPMITEKIELKPTGKKEKILGLACEQFEIKARGERMEIWATDKLLPFQPYARNQPPRFGPQMIEEQWPALLTAKKLFPLRASLRIDEGAETFRFEVKSITPAKIDDKDGKLFQPPEGYNEIQPLPF